MLRTRGTSGRVLAGAAAAVALGALTVLPAAPAAADSVRDQQSWVLNMLDVPSAWQVSEGSSASTDGGG